MVYRCHSREAGIKIMDPRLHGDDTENNFLALLVVFQPPLQRQPL